MWLILLKEDQEVALRGCHNDLGHLGLECMLSLLRDWFYWPSMLNDAEGHTWICERCLQFKAKPQREELFLILATFPFKVVHVDFLTVKSPRTGKDVNVLVITGHFSR